MKRITSKIRLPKTVNAIVILFAVCLFAFSIRAYGINAMGRTLDEDYIVEKGYKFVSMFVNKDFANPYWWNNADHPPLGNYIYGIAAYNEKIGFDPNKLSLDHAYRGVAIFPYDLTDSRLIAILLSVLTIYLTTFIGLRFIGKFGGLIAGVTMSGIPFFVGLSKNANLDIVFSFFFTTTVVLYLLYLEKPFKGKAILAGIFLGLTLLTKETGVILFPLLISLFILQKMYKLKAPFVDLFLTLFTSIIPFLVLWPMSIIHAGYVLNFTRSLWLKAGGYPELFLGKLRMTPIFYYFLYVLISVPAALVVTLLVGIGKILISRRRILYMILLWLILPLIIQSFYKGRQHELRYVIEIYAPLSLIIGYGIASFVNKLSKTVIVKVITVFILVSYLLFTLIKIYPYYLDYFNEFVGGTNNVYRTKLFQLGFGGQGLGEASFYLKTHTNKYSTVAVCADPSKNMDYSLPFKYSSCDLNRVPDYIVVNYYYVIRDGFNEKLIGKNYKKIYTVYADKAELVHVYKRKINSSVLKMRAVVLSGVEEDA